MTSEEQYQLHPKLKEKQALTFKTVTEKIPNRQTKGSK